MAHLSDLDWLTPGEEALKRFKKGDEVKAKVLTVDVDKERIGLGLKQLDDDPYQGADARRGKTVTCTVTAVHEHSVEVEIFGSLRGEIKRSDLARDRDEQRPSRFAPGDKVDAKLLQIDRNSRRISLSIKALEVQEEKKAVQDYGSTDSGASLGDILGAALDRKTQEEAARASEAEESADES